jgi:hypothetical protein
MEAAPKPSRRASEFGAAVSMLRPQLSSAAAALNAARCWATAASLLRSGSFWNIKTVFQRATTRLWL